MNVKNMRKEHRWILLESSGELSTLNQWRLRRALARDPELQQYAEALHGVSELQKSHTPNAPAYHTGVLEHHARRRKEAGAGGDFFSLWQPAIGYGAAAIALVMAVLYLSHNWEPDQTAAQTSAEESELLLAWEDPFLDDLSEMNQTMAQYDSEVEIPDFQDDLDQLAWELLTLGESS